MNRKMTIEEKIERLLEIKRRNDMMILMRRAGYSFEEIGRQFGISRQRVHQILSQIEQQDKEIFGKGDRNG